MRACAWLSLVVVVLAGCGGGAGGHRVSGKVTFNGQPVPAGSIFFTPDGSKGNTGPTGYATIKDGQYDTGAAGGMGVGTGPMVVAIEGLDPAASGDAGKGDTSGEKVMKTLFARWETKLDVTGPMTKDFEVPADAGKPAAKGGA